MADCLDLLKHFLGEYTTNLPNEVVLNFPSSHSSRAVTLAKLTTTTTLKNVSTKRMDCPSVHLSWYPSKVSASADHHFLGFQSSEFALPIQAPDSSLKFNYFNRPGFIRPRVVFPLIIMSKTREDCLMLAPLDSFHHQVLAVVGCESGLQRLDWGWSGDLDTIPAGFSSTLAIISADSPRKLLDTWGGLVCSLASESGLKNERGRYADVCTSKLSMWTDNGASYWYRNEEDMDLPSTLEATVSHLEKIEVPIASVEFDSWFYPHEVTRQVTAMNYPNVVPPTGMLLWEPRSDVLGEGSMKALRKRVGGRPLILHSRHISSKSSYLEDPLLNEVDWWVDGDRAHPEGAALFQRWMQQAADWGATAYEQDWLVEVWQGVRQLRETPGRIETWQQQLNTAARDYDIDLIWCMATAADMAHAASLSQVVAVRSCDDYRYAEDPSILWRWHLTVSAMLRSLGLFPFKDVFMSHSNNSSLPDLNGDPNAMLEACLSTLSAGPVGIGDRMGRTDINVVNKTCRSDGVIIKPDLPLAAMDRSLRNPSGILWGETRCGPWQYIIAIRTGIWKNQSSEDMKPMRETLELESGTEALVYDWRASNIECTSEISVRLRLHEWRLFVICPIFKPQDGKCSFALIGDPNTFATVGDRRIRHPQFGLSESAMSFDVLGVQGEDVEIAYWSNTKGLRRSCVKIAPKGWNRVSLRANLEGEVALSEI